MDREFYEFVQPQRPFQPRTLLLNFVGSKVAQNRRDYQAPTKRRTQINPTSERDGDEDDELEAIPLSATHTPQPKPDHHPKLTSSYSKIPWAREELDELRTERAIGTASGDKDQTLESRRRIDEILEYDVMIRQITQEIVDSGVFSERYWDKYYFNSN
jgi:hypothetical protein